MLYHSEPYGFKRCLLAPNALGQVDLESTTRELWRDSRARVRTSDPLRALVKLVVDRDRDQWHMGGNRPRRRGEVFAGPTPFMMPSCPRDEKLARAAVGLAC